MYSFLARPEVASTIVWGMLGWFFAYVAIICLRFDWSRLTSISASSYLWEGAAAYVYFTGWLAGLGLFSLLLIPAIPYMGIPLGLMAMGFAWAGVTTDHGANPKSGQDEWHTAGTILSIAAAFFGAGLAYGLWWPIIPFIGAGGAAIALFRTHWIFIVECIAACCIALLLSLLL